MPPRRPLPDLCLISVFKMLTPNDQLKAAEMSPRCAVLVRAANRPVKTLVIASSDGFEGEKTKYRLNCFSLASDPIMKLLPAGGDPFPDYPMVTTHLSKWNCLLVNNKKLLNQPTVEQIVNVFSAVTDLKFEQLGIVSSENLISLLQHPQWTNQLTSLAVFGFNDKTGLPTRHRLIAAINTLSALQCLSVKWPSALDLPNLTILAQLKVFHIDKFVCGDGCGSCAAFLHSLELLTEGNVDLQVYLSVGCSLSSLLALGEPFCTQIVCYDDSYLYWAYDDVPRFCRQFPSLTSFSVLCNEASQLEALFTAISTLPQLVRLELSPTLDEYEAENQLTHQPQLIRRPTAQSTVRALDLYLGITTHSQVQWLNLPVTMPRLQVNHIRGFRCASCGVDLNYFLQGKYSEDSKPNISTALECFRATLPLLHPGVPDDRIILGDRRPYPTIEQLLSTSQ